MRFSIILTSLFFITVLVFNLNKTETVSSLTESGDNYLYINFVDKQLNQIFYQYDLNKKTNKELLREKITEYPTATYSKSNNEVFFTQFWI
ncbi:hypothetical protein [Oceanobacillus caeni]|uniref:hypothetical protein n=1 Tax=Oceanobacillus caeni TaxID=405946 RepID=UPI001956CB3F|nr:hypothetical protein [Oceanobacillus caeni]MBU8791214.1 hypothetical protein [Oceanobacillus caeni]